MCVGNSELQCARGSPVREPRGHPGVIPYSHLTTLDRRHCMATFKLTNSHRALIREMRATGFSLRAIASRLEATEGVKVSAQAVKDALDRDGPGVAMASSPAAQLPATGEKVAIKPAESTGERTEVADSVEGDAADYDLISKVIDGLAEDIEKARKQGNLGGQATLERLRLDALKRRRDLRPPAPPSEVDTEILDAGRRAVIKLEALLEAHLAGRAA